MTRRLILLLVATVSPILAQPIEVGARLGHCLFYDPAYYLSNPLKILKVCHFFFLR